MIAPQLAAPFHQHLFNVRLDAEVDGPTNSVYEVDTRPVPPGPDNPWSNAFAPVATLLETETRRAARRRPGRQPVLEDRQPALGEPTGDPRRLQARARVDTHAARRPGLECGQAGRLRHPQSVGHPLLPDERRAAGDYPNQHAGGDGLPSGRRRTGPSSTRDIVVWYTFGVTHVPRPEDWPVMPVEYAGFTLVPVGFFDRNPGARRAPAPGATADLPHRE